MSDYYCPCGASNPDECAGADGDPCALATREVAERIADLSGGTVVETEHTWVVVPRYGDQGGDAAC